MGDGAREALLAVVRSARDRLAVTWLADGGLRIGELCGLHLADLHLQENAACGECRSPHLHVCHRPANLNRARAKTKHPWRIEDGTVTGGLVKRVSPAMVHTYFDYLTGEYPRDAGHGTVLVQLAGPEIHRLPEPAVVEVLGGDAGDPPQRGRRVPAGDPGLRARVADPVERGERQVGAHRRPAADLRAAGENDRRLAFGSTSGSGRRPASSRPSTRTSSTSPGPGPSPPPS